MFLLSIRIPAVDFGEEGSGRMNSIQGRPQDFFQGGHRRRWRGTVAWHGGVARWRGTVVERRSLAGELSLSCARPAADG